MDLLRGHLCFLVSFEVLVFEDFLYASSELMGDTFIARGCNLWR